MHFLLICSTFAWLHTVESQSQAKMRNLSEDTGSEVENGSQSSGSGLGCYRFRFETELLTPRTLQVMFCYTSFAASGGVDHVLSCMDLHGIKPNDEDMKDVIQFMPQVKKGISINNV